MKNVIVAIILGICLLGAAFIFKTYPTSLENGRYQLFQGKYTNIYQDKKTNTPAGTFEINALFLIDSATGECWHYGAGTLDGKTRDRWLPCVRNDYTQLPVSNSPPFYNS